MNSTASKIQSALRHAIDDSAQVSCINGQLLLSPYLSGSFNLYRGEALGTSILVVEDVAGGEGASKRLKALEKAVGESATAFLPSPTAAQKRKMMAARQGFITEQGDLYLPQLAIALRAASEKWAPSPRVFSPAQQQAFLYCLLCDNPLTQEGLRRKTGMSAAGASRALSSLADLGLVDYKVGGKTGRKRLYFVPDKRTLFQNGKKLFGDPIRMEERLPISASEALPDSGLSALAKRSALVAPRVRIVAAPSGAVLAENVETADPERWCVVQRLSYDPTPFVVDGLVDPFTMLVTIEEEDERISIALREALRECSWYTD